MGVTSTKGGRLAIIVAVGLVLAGAAVVFTSVTSSNADDDAHDLARSAYEELKAIDASEVDDVAAQDTVDAWTGDESPFTVDGHSPERISEIAGGFVVRYRVRSSGTERCVDALWPDDGGPFAVDVNRCEGYERP